MQNINLKYSVNPFENLFIYKSIELLSIYTIDSYRIRLHNPKTLLEELKEIIHSSIKGVLTNNDYVNYTSKELCQVLVRECDGLNFKQLNKEYFIKTLKTASRNNYNFILQSINIILKNNINYADILTENITNILNSYSSYINEDGDIVDLNKYRIEQKRLITLLEFYYIELINMGFSKQYLYKRIQSIFVFSKDTDFNTQYSKFQQITKDDDEKYTLIFNINDKSFKYEELIKIDDHYFFINKIRKNKLKSKISDKGKEYIDKNRETILIGVEFHAKDYYSAVQQGINKLSQDLDIYHLGYNRKQYKIAPTCLVIGEKDPKRASVTPCNYQIDGYFHESQDTFNTILSKVLKLNQNNIDQDSYKKITSAIRYYRTGSESPELETKLLNY